MKKNLFLYLLPDFLNQILWGYQLNGINKWCLQDKHIDKQIPGSYSKLLLFLSLKNSA